MVKVYNIKSSSNGTFIGEVYKKDLSKAEQKFMANHSYEETDRIKVSGEYQLEWDDDIAMPQVTSVTYFDYNQNWIDIANVDLELIEQHIADADHYGDWQADRAGSLADYYHDSMEDR